jgi:hypothetical protein
MKDRLCLSISGNLQELEDKVLVDLKKLNFRVITFLTERNHTTDTLRIAK